VGFDGLDDGLDAIHNGGEIRFRVQGLETVVRAVPGQGGHLGAFDQGFRGYAAGIEAVAAHAIFFHQGDAGLDGGSDIGAHQAAGTGTDDDQVAVKLLWLVPAAIDLRSLYRSKDGAGQPGKQAQQDKGPDQSGGKDIPGALQLRHLGTGVHIDGGARQHPHLADPVEGPGFQGGERHHQVDQEEREHRHQAQGEQIKGAVFGNALIDGFQAFAKALLHRIPQQVAGHQKRQGSTQGRGKGDDHQPGDKTKNGAPRQGHNGGTGYRQGGHHYIHQKKYQPAQ